MSVPNKVVFAVGDIHGDFAELNDFINNKIRQNPRIRQYVAKNDAEILILQCGDLAFFWPGEDHSKAIRNRVDFAKDGLAKIYWCGGNHEDWDRLYSLFPTGSLEDRTNMAEVGEGLYFMRFGATLDISPDIRVLFAGGAESHDWIYRRRGINWWPDKEGISDEDMARLANVDRADWIVSHTAPGYFPINRRGGSFNEPSRLRLNEVFDRYRPRKWYFGHFHRLLSLERQDCKWTCLANADGEERFWELIYPQIPYGEDQCHQ